MSAKPRVISTACTYDVPETAHPSITEFLRLPANTALEVEESQVEFLLTLRGVELAEAAVAPVEVPAVPTPEPEEADAPSLHEEA